MQRRIMLISHVAIIPGRSERTHRGTRNEGGIGNQETEGIIEAALLIVGTANLLPDSPLHRGGCDTNPGAAHRPSQDTSGGAGVSPVWTRMPITGQSIVPFKTKSEGLRQGFDALDATTTTTLTTTTIGACPHGLHLGHGPQHLRSGDRCGVDRRRGVIQR